MFDYKVIFTGEKVFKADSIDHAEELAEKYLKEISNPLKVQIFSIRTWNTKGDN